jgi:membrane-associated protein
VPARHLIAFAGPAGRRSVVSTPRLGTFWSSRAFNLVTGGRRLCWVHQQMAPGPPPAPRARTQGDTTGTSSDGGGSACGEGETGASGGRPAATGTRAEPAAADAGAFPLPAAGPAAAAVGVRPGGEATRWRPWLGRPRARDLICVTGVLLSGVWGLAMIPLTPVLIATRPVLLELLAGSTPSIVAAGSFSGVSDKLQMTVVVAAALPGLIKFDMFYWWAGALWGPQVMHWFGRRGGRWEATVRLAERRGGRYAAPAVMISAFLPGAPTPLIYAAAGWTGLGPLAFFLSDAAGSTIWAVMLATFGHELGANGVAAANLVSRYALIATLILLAIFTAPHAWHAARAWRARSRARLDAQPDPAPETPGQLP